MNEFKEIPASKISISMRKPVRSIGINDANYATKTTINGKKVKCPYYDVWSNMIERCYGQKNNPEHMAYTGCTVDKEWHLFSNFKAWMEKQNWKGKQLDKDILFYGNKVYSPKNCLFVSRQINNLFIVSPADKRDLPVGVYYMQKARKFKATVSIYGQNKHLGSFDTAEEARKAYKEAKADHIRAVAEDYSNDILLYTALINYAKRLLCLK